MAGHLRRDLVHRVGDQVAGDGHGARVGERLRLLDSFDHAAAFVMGRGMFLLVMNATAKALLLDPDQRPAARHNLALWRFLDPEARQRYAGWEAVAYDTAAMLRKDVVEDPDADPPAH